MGNATTQLGVNFWKSDSAVLVLENCNHSGS